MQPDPIGYGTWLLPELAEAASRTGDRHAARVRRSSGSRNGRGVIRSDWLSGIEARIRALLSEGEVADALYRESIEHLSRTRLRLELARTHLLYGEWLRRERRRIDAREQLRPALESFTEDRGRGVRATRRARAAGHRRARSQAHRRDARRAHAAGSADLPSRRRGTQNREIAAQLFISPSTVEYHLRKVFRKLDVKSRTQLASRLRA